MSALLYKEFVLRGPLQWQQVLALVKGNAKACNDAGKPLRLIVTQDEKKRSREQNACYWAYLTQIAEQAWVGGRTFDKEVWHEFFARQFGPQDELILPDGEVVLRRKSTTQMTVGEFSEYIEKVAAHAVTELGVNLER